jgi:uncharacterized membrane protein YkvA (DUF1232 family)/GTP-binding protein EngB required for normal cell division
MISKESWHATPRSVWHQQAEGVEMEKLVIGFVGTVSSGKSTAISKLFGVDVEDIDPLPGSTKSVKLIPHPSHCDVVIGDLPGLGDMVESVSDKAKDALSALDIIVNMVNADGGVSEQEVRNLGDIRATGKPFITCINKIDLIDQSDRKVLYEDTKVQLGLGDQEVVMTAFDPNGTDPELMIGVGHLNYWIVETLTKRGKELLYLKSLKKESPHEFDEKGFWNIVKKLLGKVPFVPDAVALYYCMMASNTPLTDKVAIASVLAYFIWPMDMIPEGVLGLLGYADDASAIMMLSSLIREECRKKADEALGRL